MQFFYKEFSPPNNEYRLLQRAREVEETGGGAGGTEAQEEDQEDGVGEGAREQAGGTTDVYRLQQQGQYTN